MSGIFISYRREDTTAYARLLSESLGSHFGQEQIFRDVDTLGPGVDFPQAVAEAVGNCDVLLALIGKKWLAARRQGKRRLDDPHDYVRLEIAAALERDTLVVPVLMEDTRMPRRQDLPDALAELADRNAHRLTDESWNDGVRRLVDALEAVVKPSRPDKPAPRAGSPAGGTQSPPAPAPQPQPQSSQWSSASPARTPSSSWGTPPAAPPGGYRPPAPDEGDGGAGKRVAVIAGAAAAALAVVVVVAVLALSGGGGGGAKTPNNPTIPSLPFDPNAFFAETNAAITPTSGPAGTTVTVTGSGFLPNEGIEIHFFVDVVTQTRADEKGAFSGVTFAVPDDRFVGVQYDVSAFGKRSYKSAQAQFRVTA